MATARTHCAKGHPLSGRNLGGTTIGRRWCKQCKEDRARKAAPKHPHPGFRPLEMTSMVRFDQPKARARILEAYKAAGASFKGAAEVLGVAERTIHRWIDRLELRPTLAKVAEKEAAAS